MVASSYSASLFRAIRSPHLLPTKPLLLLQQRNATLQQNNIFINQHRNNTRSFHATNANMVVKILGSLDAYKAAVEESNSKLVVIDFFAEWCGPCRLIAPKVEAFSEDFSEKVSFYKLDVDQLQEAAAENSVRAMPTFLLFKDGVKTAEVVGANPSALKAAIEKHSA